MDPASPAVVEALLAPLAVGPQRQAATVAEWPQSLASQSRVSPRSECSGTRTRPAAEAERLSEVEPQLAAVVAVEAVEARNPVRQVPQARPAAMVLQAQSDPLDL